MGLHDSGYKLLFSYPYLVECLIRGFVPGSWTFLPSRISDANVPKMEKLEEVIPMITQNSIDWTAEWREKGEAEGRRKGEAELLLRQLNLLYGPLASDIEERIHGAEADQLLKWGERLVKSSSLDEIFVHD